MPAAQTPRLSRKNYNVKRPNPSFGVFLCYDTYNFRPYFLLIGRETDAEHDRQSSTSPQQTTIEKHSSNTRSQHSTANDRHRLIQSIKSDVVGGSSQTPATTPDDPCTVNKQQPAGISTSPLASLLTIDMAVQMTDHASSSCMP